MLKKNPKAKPFSIVIPPPNVTGSLHMGHALNNTLQDVLARFERMRGRDVLWQPGTDHAGIATQSLVERQLLEKQEPGRRELGREEFLKRVWAWKEHSGGTIVNQLKRLGASCDWSRERFTMDEGLSRAVIKVFVELYQAGLIYKDKRLVNWDPKLQTAISDLEVIPVETKGYLWYFKYPIKNPGKLKHKFITVATTRPETMLGDTAVAVNPNDKRWKPYIGKMVVLPLVGHEIPIVADEHADPEQGSGAVKITPAHDFNDFEVGRRHNLPLVNLFDTQARLKIQGNPAFIECNLGAEDWQFLLDLDGLDRFEARKRVVERLETLGLVEKIEPHTLKVPYGDRSHEVIEPYLTDQWYVDAKTLAQPALAAVREGKTHVHPRQLAERVFPVAGQHSALVHLAPALVGAPHSGMVWPQARGPGRARHREAGPRGGADVPRRAHPGAHRGRSAIPADPWRSANLCRGLRGGGDQARAGLLRPQDQGAGPGAA